MAKFLKKYVSMISVIRCFYYRVFLSNANIRTDRTVIKQPTQFVGKGSISIGSSHLGIWPSPFFIKGSGYVEARNSSARVEIGDYTYINNNFVIIADKKLIKIGDRCLIGPDFFVADSDFHGISVKNRFSEEYDCGSVIIEDDVFIGDGVRILKGVKVGQGSIIGSRSLVVHDIDPNSIYAGVPAKKIRNL
jgi:maltose O-acetyltransferase